MGLVNGIFLKNFFAPLWVPSRGKKVFAGDCLWETQCSKVRPRCFYLGGLWGLLVPIPNNCS
jgi:hypothetical protein